jgi:hypothetical protein
MLATCQFRVLFYYPVSSLKKLRLKCMKLQFYLFFYGCGTWPLTLWVEHRLRVFENRMLRRISGPNCEKVVENWRRLHGEKLY